MNDREKGQHIHDAIHDLQQQVVEQGKRIEKLWDTVIDCAEHIEKLEARATLNADEDQRLQVVANAAVIRDLHACSKMDAGAIGDLRRRIEKLEAALRDVVRCLIDGSVDVNKASLRSDTFHEHRILGVGPVLTMVEVYRRLEE